VGEEPEKKGKRDAKKKASDDGKVKRGVFAAMNDVAGKLSQAEGEFVAEVQKCTNKNEKCSQGKKGAAEIAERVHEVILPEARESGDTRSWKVRVGCHRQFHF
jgi:hypothetical protein